MQPKAASVNRPTPTRMPKGLAAKAGTPLKKATKGSRPALKAEPLTPPVQKEPPVEAPTGCGEVEEDGMAPPPILRELEVRRIILNMCSIYICVCIYNMSSRITYVLQLELPCFVFTTMV